MFYAHVDFLKYNFSYHCVKCSFELFSAKGINWQELIVASSKFFKCQLRHDENSVSSFKNQYCETTVNVKEKNKNRKIDKTFSINLKTISNLLGRFDPDELIVCYCKGFTGYLVNDNYPACCISCGNWVKIDAEPNRTRHLSYDNFREIYSASKYLRHMMAQQDHTVLIPHPFLRNW